MDKARWIHVPVVRRAIAAAIFFSLGAAVMAANLARVLENPASANKVASWGPAALGKVRGQLIGIQVGQKEFDIVSARRALASAPLASEPFAVIAASSLSGDPRGTTATELALLREALRRDPRSRAARILTLRSMAASGNLTGAFEQLDVLNRLSPVLVARAMDSIARLVSTPERMDLALKSLANHRSLYGPFVDGMVGKNKSSAILVRLANGLPPYILAMPTIRNSVVAQLVDAGEIALARSLWLRGIPSAPPGLVFSPDFSDRRTSPPFNWQMLAGPSGSAEFGRNGGLAVVYYDRSPGRLARQIVTLAPGRYRLSTEFKLLSGSADNVRLQVFCSGASKPLAEIPLFSNGAGAARSQATVVVPAQSCDGQELVVAGVIVDRRSETELDLRRVDITPAGAN